MKKLDIRSGKALTNTGKYSFFPKTPALPWMHRGLKVVLEMTKKMKERPDSLASGSGLRRGDESYPFSISHSCKRLIINLTPSGDDEVSFLKSTTFSCCRICHSFRCRSSSLKSSKHIVAGSIHKFNGVMA